MNAHEKFRQAVSEYDAATANREHALQEVEKAEARRTSAANELARVTHAVFGKKTALWKGRRFSSPDGQGMMIETSMDVIVSPGTEDA